jgi:hypothetical protein
MQVTVIKEISSKDLTRILPIPTESNWIIETNYKSAGILGKSPKQFMKAAANIFWFAS